MPYVFPAYYFLVCKIQKKLTTCFINSIFFLLSYFVFSYKKKSEIFMKNKFRSMKIKLNHYIFDENIEILGIHPEYYMRIFFNSM